MVVGTLKRRPNQMCVCRCTYCVGVKSLSYGLVDVNHGLADSGVNIGAIKYEVAYAPMNTVSQTEIVVTQEGVSEFSQSYPWSPPSSHRLCYPAPFCESDPLVKWLAPGARKETVEVSSGRMLIRKPFKVSLSPKRDCIRSRAGAVDCITQSEKLANASRVEKLERGGDLAIRVVIRPKRLKCTHTFCPPTFVLRKTAIHT